MALTAIQEERIQSTLAMQFPGIDLYTLVDTVEISVSRKTGRIRTIYDVDTGDRLFSLRTSDGRFLPSFELGRRLLEAGYTHNRVTMMSDAAPFIAAGKSAFCKHVIAVDDEVIPGTEVFLLDEDGAYLAVGTAQHPGYAMLELMSGMAVRIKHARDKQ